MSILLWSYLKEELFLENDLHRVLNIDLERILISDDSAQSLTLFRADLRNCLFNLLTHHWLPGLTDCS